MNLERLFHTCYAMVQGLFAQDEQSKDDLDNNLKGKVMKELQMERIQEEGKRNEQFAKLISDAYDYKELRRGEVREAVVLAVEENEVLVDLGVKRDGVVPPQDLNMLDQAYLDRLQEGKKVPVFVLSANFDRDQILVSIHKGLAQQDWLRAKELLESGETFEAEVLSPNRGGILVQFGRLQGFVPNSHLVSISRWLRGDRHEQAKQELVGKMLSLAVLEVNRRRRRLVFSERCAQQYLRQQLFEELVEGETRTGIVRGLAEFGAFVDLGGVDGLIHISELDWHYVQHPKEVLSVGDTIEVYVLSVDRERERIALSRKRLLPDPWSTVVENLEQDQILGGVVTRIVNFGLFVEVGKGVEGLIHRSEIPQELDVESELAPGSEIKVRLLHIDNWRRRISLSLWGTESAVRLPEAETSENVPS